MDSLAATLTYLPMIFGLVIMILGGILVVAMFGIGLVMFIDFVVGWTQRDR